MAVYTAPSTLTAIAAAYAPITCQVIGGVGGEIDAVLDPGYSGNSTGNSAYAEPYDGGVWYWNTVANEFSTDTTYS